MESQLAKDYLNESYIVDPFWSDSAISAKYADMFVDNKVANGLCPVKFNRFGKPKRRGTNAGKGWRTRRENGNAGRNGMFKKEELV